MDFHTLLYKAQKNNTKEKKVNCFKASLDPPKKESKESRQLSDSIKKFLAKKEEEEKQKQLEEQKKKNELTSLRNQDKKSFKRVQSMLNRTKSANKSVIEDAKDDVNTSVTMAGFNQPDEDDYGYVSKDAMAIYNNIMNKYVNTPADTRNTKVVNNKSIDISEAKSRVKAALLKEEEEQLLPHKRKRKPKDIENDIEQPQQKKLETNFNAEKIKKRHIQPPPLNFQELLKIAEKKQYEPIMIEKPKNEEVLPMMTKKEKVKYLEEKKIEARIIARRQGKCVSPIKKEIKPVEKPQKPVASSSKVDIHAEDKLKKNASVWSKDAKIRKEFNTNGQNEKYIPKSLNDCVSEEVKLNGSNRNIPNTGLKKYSGEKKNNSNYERYSPKPKSINDRYIPSTKTSVEDRYLPKSRTLPNNDKYVPKSSSSSEKYSLKPTSMPSDKHLSKPISNESTISKSKIPNDAKCPQKLKSITQPEKYVPKSKCLSFTDQYIPSTIKRSDEKYNPNRPKISQSIKSKFTNSKEDKYIPKPVNKSNKLPSNNNNSCPKDLTPKQFPPRDMVPKQFPPRDLVPKQFPPADMTIKRNGDRHMPARNKRRVIESDSEYDSDLDDFIVDESDEETDYSKVISEIFKYDKSKYRGRDDDNDECMESDFRTLQKEEYKSTRAGLLEDLADIRREKAMMKRRKNL